MADQQIQCGDCGTQFAFTESEQQFYVQRGLAAPKRCKSCRDARKSQRAAAPREMHDAVCGKCGAQCQVPFKPRPPEEGGRPVLCLTCFKAERDAQRGAREAA
jgi:CxxC-x17-CxxC domain-containing protein